MIELRGDSKQFKLSLLNDDGLDSVNYRAKFAPTGTDWQTLHFPIAAFRASFRGRGLPANRHSILLASASSVLSRLKQQH